jgi:hypothetical protein
MRFDGDMFRGVTVSFGIELAARRESLLTGFACLLLFLLLTSTQTAAQTVTAPDSAKTQTEGAVTVSDHFKTFTDSMVTTLEGSIQTVGAPLVTTGFSQLFTAHAGFGNDAAGFGQHYGVNVLGNVTGKFFGKFVLPSALHQDERYQCVGPGHSPIRRLGHVAEHLFMTRSADHSYMVFNASAIPNSLLTAALSNSYQPVEQRTAANSTARFGYNVLGFVAGDAYSEFKPDLCSLAALLKSGIQKL